MRRCLCVPRRRIHCGWTLAVRCKGSFLLPLASPSGLGSVRRLGGSAIRCRTAMATGARRTAVRRWSLDAAAGSSAHRLPGLVQLRRADPKLPATAAHASSRLDLLAAVRPNDRPPSGSGDVEQHRRQPSCRAAGRPGRRAQDPAPRVQSCVHWLPRHFAKLTFLLINLFHGSGTITDRLHPFRPQVALATAPFLIGSDWCSAKVAARSIRAVKNARVRAGRERGEPGGPERWEHRGTAGPDEERRQRDPGAPTTRIRARQQDSRSQIRAACTAFYSRG